MLTFLFTYEPIIPLFSVFTNPLVQKTIAHTILTGDSHHWLSGIYLWNQFKFLLWGPCLVMCFVTQCSRSASLFDTIPSTNLVTEICCFNSFRCFYPLTLTIKFYCTCQQKLDTKLKKSGIKNESMYKIHQLFWHPSSLLDKPCHR